MVTVTVDQWIIDYNNQRCKCFRPSQPSNIWAASSSPIQLKLNCSCDLRNCRWLANIFSESFRQLDTAQIKILHFTGRTCRCHSSPPPLPAPPPWPGFGEVPCQKGRWTSKRQTVGSLVEKKIRTQVNILQLYIPDKVSPSGYAVWLCRVQNWSLPPRKTCPFVRYCWHHQ